MLIVVVAQSTSQATESRASMRPTESLTEVTDIEIPESRATINNFVSITLTDRKLIRYSS